MNPADIAQRGSRVGGVHQAKQWLHGPSFLCRPMTEWPEPPDGLIVFPEKDPEVKPSVKTGVVMQSSSLIEQLLQCSSICMRVKRITAWNLKMFDS